MERHPVLPAQMVAIEDGRGTYFYGNGNCAARDVVTIETRYEDRCATFHPMEGYTIAQTVAMKIEGVHGPRDGAHDTRKCPSHWLAVY